MFYTNTRSKTDSALVLILGILVAAILLFTGKNALERNMLSSRHISSISVNVLNYVISAAKTYPVNNSEYDESKTSLKTALLKLIGLDIANPAKIIEKELPYKGITFNSVGNNSIAVQEYSILPFNLNDLHIFKESSDILPQNDAEMSFDNAGNASTPTQENNTSPDVFDPAYKKQIDVSKPDVLIYHTHTSESYIPAGDRFSNDEKKNVCAVGSLLTRELERYNISVIHDKTIHDTLYVKSYTRSGETLNQYLKKYSDLKLIIDMHRDGGITKKDAVTAKVNKENAAKIMFVMSKGNPHFKQNQEVVKNLQAISNRLYPGFCRDTYYWDNKINHFNQEKSNNAVLIEVGADINTLNEAQTSAKYIGRIVAEYLKKNNNVN